MAEYYTSSTGRSLPEKFKSDLRSNVVSVVCRVVIEPSGDLPWEQGENIYLSTHEMNFDGNHYKPLLLENPRIKHSIGLEDGRFKISNVSMSISNVEYNGVRFSDSLYNNSIVNSVIRIIYQTQTALNDDDCLEVYTGTVRDIQENNNILRLQLEDHSQVATSVQLPRHKVGSTGRDHYAGRPIPFVYGHVIKAPAVIDVDGSIKADSSGQVELVVPFETDGYQGIGSTHYYQDSSSMSSVFNDDVVHPLWIYSGNTYANIPMFGLETILQTRKELSLDHEAWNLPSHYEGVRQWSQKSNGTIKIENNYLIKKNVMQGLLIGKPSGVELTKRTSMVENYMGDGTGGFNNPDNFNEQVNIHFTDGEYVFEDIEQLNGFEPAHEWSYSYANWFDSRPFSDLGYDAIGGSLNPCVNQLLMRLRVNVSPDFEGYGHNTQIAINGHRLPRLNVHVPPYLDPDTPEGEEDDWDGGGGMIWIRSRHGSESYNDDIGFNMYGTENVIADGSIWLNMEHAVYNLKSNTLPEEFQFYKIFKFPEQQQVTWIPGYGWDYTGLQEGEESPEDWSNALHIKNISTSGDYDWINNIGLYSPIVPFIMLQNRSFEGNFDIYFGINGWTAPQWHHPDYEITESDGDTYFPEHSDPSIVNRTVSLTMTLGGRISELDMRSVVDIKNALTSNIYLNIDGRRNEDGLRIVNAIAILRDIILTEMSLDPENYIDQDSYETAYSLSNINLAFSVNEFTTARDLFEDISKSIFCFPHFKLDGKIGFPMIRSYYTPQDHEDSFKIQNADIISYSFSKTAPEDIYTRVDVDFDFDYETSEYSKSVSNSYGAGSMQGITPLSMNDRELSFYGYKDTEDNVLHFKTKYIRELEDARKLADLLFYYNKNQHLKVTLKLPLKYIGIEIGSIISFEELVDGKKAYGIDYTKMNNFTRYLESGYESNGQWIYPLFFVQSVNFSYDYIEIDAVQLHFLDNSMDVNNATWWQNIGLHDVVEMHGLTIPQWDSLIDWINSSEQENHIDMLNHPQYDKRVRAFQFLDIYPHILHNLGATYPESGFIGSGYSNPHGLAFSEFIYLTDASNLNDENIDVSLLENTAGMYGVVSENSGIYQLFSPTNFSGIPIMFEAQGGVHYGDEIQFFNYSDLVPAIWDINNTTDENSLADIITITFQGWVLENADDPSNAQLKEINDGNVDIVLDYSDLDSGSELIGNFVYKMRFHLRNMQTEIGQPFDLKWVAESAYSEYSLVEQTMMVGKKQMIDGNIVFTTVEIDSRGNPAYNFSSDGVFETLLRYSPDYDYTHISTPLEFGDLAVTQIIGYGGLFNPGGGAGGSPSDDDDSALQPHWGDGNFDGQVDILDIVYMINVVMGNAELGSHAPEEMEEEAMDVNFDGNLNVLDAVLLTNYVLQIGVFGDD